MCHVGLVRPLVGRTSHVITLASLLPRHACPGRTRAMPTPVPDRLPPPRRSRRVRSHLLNSLLASHDRPLVPARLAPSPPMPAAPSTIHVACGDRRVREARGRDARGPVGAGGEGARRAGTRGIL
ncbi:hypothetical protein GUJ93_ZPchr0012g21114 [Zizania palustris]|uniref:Uncharacterized protein n=1 Tax=Zizania palustris TaxID=103762 RepID=A0A8J5WP23_ZIZPA|nr:hypothetical protein GUJ93_ZPchr0012g21114 [Zizania palustris]